MMSFFLIPNGAAQRWSFHSSEAEVTELIVELFEKFELPSAKVKYGSYPLFTLEPEQKLEQAFPLISAPCPILSDCENFISHLRARLVQRGYHLVYSDVKPRFGGPQHFAIAKGKKPVLALRLYPASTLATIVLQLSTTYLPKIEELVSMDQHITYTLTEELLTATPKLKTWLEQNQREYLISINHLTIRRSLIDQTSGEILQAAIQRQKAFRRMLNYLVSQAPYSIGFYVDSLAMTTLDRSLLDELLSYASQQQRVLLFEKTPNPIPLSVARTFAVRAFDLKKIETNSPLSSSLKALEANLVLEGEISTLIDMKQAQWSELNTWLNKLKKREVVFLRLSETAW